MTSFRSYVGLLYHLSTDVQQWLGVNQLDDYPDSMYEAIASLFMTNGTNMNEMRLVYHASYKAADPITIADFLWYDTQSTRGHWRDEGERSTMVGDIIVAIAPEPLLSVTRMIYSPDRPIIFRPTLRGPYIANP